MILCFCVFAFGTVWASLGRRRGLAQTQTGPHKNTKPHTPGAGRRRAVVGHCVAWVRVIRKGYSFRNQPFKQPLRSNLSFHPNILCGSVRAAGPNWPKPRRRPTPAQAAQPAYTGPNRADRPKLIQNKGVVVVLWFCVFAFGAVWASLGRRRGLAQTAPPAQTGHQNQRVWRTATASNWPKPRRRPTLAQTAPTNRWTVGLI